MAESVYLRYPHIARDLITFTAEDDVWLASLSEAANGRGTRAWRLTADRAPVLHPRLNPPATHVAWTSTRDGTRSLGRGAPREAYVVPVAGGPVRRLTYWSDRFASVRGWVSDDEVLVLSRTGQHTSMKTWAFAVSLSGPARRLGYGSAGDVTVRDGAVLVGSAMNAEPAEPAEWKGYRGADRGVTGDQAGRPTRWGDRQRRSGPDPGDGRTAGRVEADVPRDVAADAGQLLARRHGRGGLDRDGFHWDLYTEFARDGLIVDLRDAQGGGTSQLVVEKLARRIIGWYECRNEEPSSYPFEAPRGPIVAITNEYAMSGGDVVVQALKSYGIATVVGTRTWGGVIGCYFNELVDGTMVTQPTSALWFADVGWAVENHGVEPDVEVAIAPHDWAAGRDPQLGTAVRLALHALRQRTPAAPPTV